jgi:hypothetical protein
MYLYINPYHPKWVIEYSPATWCNQKVGFSRLLLYVEYYARSMDFRYVQSVSLCSAGTAVRRKIGLGMMGKKMYFFFFTYFVINNTCEIYVIVGVFASVRSLIYVSRLRTFYYRVDDGWRLNPVLCSWFTLLLLTKK